MNQSQLTPNISGSGKLIITAGEIRLDESIALSNLIRRVEALEKAVYNAQ